MLSIEQLEHVQVFLTTFSKLVGKIGHFDGKTGHFDEKTGHFDEKIG